MRHSLLIRPVLLFVAAVSKTMSLMDVCDGSERKPHDVPSQSWKSLWPLRGMGTSP